MNRGSVMSKAKFLEKLQLNSDSVHCIGIGGIGVSAIAELLLEGGFQISGSDIEINDNCRYLAGLGANISPAGHREENLPSEACKAAIATAAAGRNNPETVALLRRNIMVWSRGEFLGELASCYQRPVMVAGSHGKSSVSAMLGWVLPKLGVDCGLLAGAKYNDNTRNARLGNGDILVAESDESDCTHQLMHGELALVTNIDGDHAWTEKEQQQQDLAFCRFVRQFKKVIYIDSAKTGELFAEFDHSTALGGKHLQELADMAPAWMIGYERINAALVLAGLEYLKMDVKHAAELLNDFPGIKRRQTLIAGSSDDGIVLLEDYAHHPQELISSLEVIKKRFAGRSLTVVFQPHRYKRLNRYFKDFSNILCDPAMQIKVLPVFSAWEQKPLDCPESSDLVSEINRLGGNASEIASNGYPEAEKLLAELRKKSGKQVVALIGAGDIDRLSAALKEKIK